MKQLFALIGYPVGHSLSPLMHQAIYDDLGLDATYHAFNVEPTALKEAIAGLKALNVAGCNVTIPHKVSVMDYLDEVDEEAQEIGAVNTIVNKNGRLIGRNTDGSGYLQSLTPVLPAGIEDHRVLVIGAGGAARAVVSTLCRNRAMRIVIANRTLAKAEVLAGLFSRYESDVLAMSIEQAEKELAAFDLVINTTSVGMSPNVRQTPLSLDLLSARAFVSDLIYNPDETLLLKEAKARGNRTLNGIGMFVNQGALSFEYWTEQKPNRAAMEEAVRHFL
ncbi:shikimate dehydrogenase [Shouchella shacheensis]|uniref:shikimate dehydrogenase n=1 Tax=Shouchella shacheensis TaxID=1649580 RepID=UPI00073FCB07|nr:shikimate dehydrogenase [Shouchella shacheensis]